MRIRAHATAILGALALLSFGTIPARPDPSSPRTYKLEPSSRFERGCFDLCACPIVTEPLEGTFELRHIGFDGLFDNYAVSSVSWLVRRVGAHVAIRGSGKYRVGGEVAIQQQMTLDVSVGGDAPQHFDSGLVSGGGAFPHIDITVRLHLEPACFDTVITVRASPSPTSPVAAERRTPLELSVPIAFTRQLEMRLTLGVAGAVDLTVYDVLGRTVRHLSRNEWLPAGSHPVSWEARRDNGAPCTAGVYFVRATMDDRRAVCRVVKME